MTDDEAAEVFRLQLVALTGLPDAQISHGPLDSTRRVLPWITLIPLAEGDIGRPTRDGTSHEQSVNATLLATSYGNGATAALRNAARTIRGYSPEGLQALAAGVTLQSVSPSQLPQSVVRTGYERRASYTFVYGYVFTATVNEPPAAESVIVDLAVVDGPTYPAAITIEVP